MTVTVTAISDETLHFSDGSEMYSDHDTECCEHHYLDTSNLTLDEFKGLEFDLTSDTFFERVPDYGIRLVPLNGHPISIPGYGDNNGYYSNHLDLVVNFPNQTQRIYNITECQFDKDI